MLLLLGRLLDLPVAVAIVAGHSMEPTLHYGDLIVLVRAEPRDLRVGDIVLWCRGPTSCVVHRLVAVHGGTAITKGDANPVPDPPVPLEAVRYRVAARIPREAYVVPLATGIIAWAARLAARMGGAKAAVRALSEAAASAGLYDVTWLALAAYGAVLLLAPMYAPYPAHYYTVIQDLRPSIALRAVAVNPDGSLAAVYNVNRTVFLGASECLVAATGSPGILSYCNATTLPGPEEGTWTLVVEVPSGFYLEAYRLGLTRFRVNATIMISPGRLYTSLTYTMTWRPLQAKLDKASCSVILYNPNPVPLGANLTVKYGDTLPGGRRVVGQYAASLTVAPLSRAHAPLEPHEDLVVLISYMGPGGDERRDVLYGGCRKR